MTRMLLALLLTILTGCATTPLVLGIPTRTLNLQWDGHSWSLVAHQLR